MRKIFILSFFIFIVFALSSCYTVSKRQMLLSNINDSSFLPQKIFESEGYIYFSYADKEEFFLLSAKIPPNSSGKIESSEFVLKDISAGMFDGKERLILPDISEIWDDALMSFILENAPVNPMTGITISIFTTEAVIFKDENGALKLLALKLLPQDIDIIRNIKHEEFMEGLTDKLMADLQEAYPNQSKFIIHMKDIPRVPFMYIDIENDIAVSLVLPNYYKIRRDLLPYGFGYSTKFIYSFVIKSHVFSVIKAPVSTVHKLLNKVFVSLETIIRPTIKNTKGEIPPIDEESDSMDINAFNKYLDRNVTNQVYKAKLKTLIDGEEFFSHFTVNALKAEKDINIRLYVFSIDPYTLGLADILKMKSNEGVKVKVLLDDLNVVGNWIRYPKVVKDKNYKMPNIKSYLKRDSKVKVRTSPNSWITFAHIKAITIDDTYAYTGGMNFAEDYRYFWHDLMVLIEGPLVLRIKDDFKRAWHFAGIGGDFSVAFYAMTKKDKKYQWNTDGMYDVRILYTTPSSSEIYDAHIAAIKRAKKRIYMQNPYFSDPQIVNELIRARARGVDVRVILPAENNVNIMYKNNKIKANTLIRNGIRVYMYRGMTHVKAAIFDDWATLGSANMDRYSLYINQEMNLGVSDPGFVKELEERLFEKDFQNSDEITEPFVIAWTSYIANAFNPMK